MDRPSFVLPTTADQLIDLIDKAFPLKNPPRGADAASVHRDAGARDVVDWLRALQQERDENLAERVFDTPVT